MYDTTAYDGGSYTETVNITLGTFDRAATVQRACPAARASWTIIENLQCASTGEVSLGGYGLRTAD